MSNPINGSMSINDCVHSVTQDDCIGCWEGRAHRAERLLKMLARYAQSLCDSAFPSAKMLQDIGDLGGLAKGGEQYPNAECAYDQATFLHDKAAKLVGFLNHQFGGNLPEMLACERCAWQDEPVTPDPVQEWLQNNQDVVRQYQGKCIAIHPIKGIVASGDNFSPVLDKVRELGLEEEVTLDVVPLYPD